MEEDPASRPPPASDGPTLELAREAQRGPWVVEIGSPTHGAVLSLEPGAALTLGSGSRVDAVVEDRTVSAVHARLSATASGILVEDLASRNGVYVGSARVPVARLASRLASFVIGRTTVTVREVGERTASVPNDDPIPGLVGSSLPMRRLSAEVRRSAGLRAAVLLQGESGSGKDVVARAIHQLSRRTGQYVPLNVGAIPESLADAELFGHARGAFTGAVMARSGAFEQANRGTLFLDEIAELAPSIQVKLLRVVEERQVRAIGSPQLTDVDVRVVSASWAELEERVAEGSFREDLFHRVSTFVIRLPPLRNRKSDIPALSTGLLARIRDEVGPKQLGSAALARLVAHSWPGNVRELASVLYRAAVTSDDEHIEASHVEASLFGPSRTRPRALSEAEASLLLREHSGNVSAAARTAGVARSTFRSWLEKE
ncbi:MAG TPA: sigma 54-interacting transcriptional regulator [Polyangiaceae bacterium]|jgi:DNA-binding NtrC family response regulator|nr:sigma 54-interacting transcriptional regulator [Polyangiaceae bacterium]